MTNNKRFVVKLGPQINGKRVCQVEDNGVAILETKSLNYEEMARLARATGNEPLMEAWIKRLQKGPTK